jgi:hypothetical protein
MDRALIWKEWRQLRALRWGTAGLGVVLPALLVAGAEGARRGLSPFGTVSSYTARGILVDAVPLALALGLWPLSVLLFAAQSFGADRGAGTEFFLLERPVPRPRIWLARGLACMGSVTLVALGTGGFWAALLAAIGGPAPARWSEPVMRMASAGPAATAVTFLGGIAAASLLSAPLTAVIAGLILALLPVGLATLLVRFFPFARLDWVHVGMIAPLVLLGGYLASSWFASCLGEPAGRNRVRRGVGTLVLALLLVGALFVTAAPLAMRIEAWPRGGNFGLDPSPGGGAAVVSKFFAGGCYLVDVASARRTAFLPPPVLDGEWNREGTVLALITGAGLLGSESEERIEFLDGSGRPVFAPWHLPPADADLFVTRVWWAGNRLIAMAPVSEKNVRLYGIAPESGGTCSLDLGVPAAMVGFAGAGEDGTPVLAIDSSAPGEDPERGGLARVRFELRRFDAARCALQPRVLTQTPGVPGQPDGRLSFSGRFWLRGRPSGRSGPVAIVDLDSGQEWPSAYGAWLSDDSLAWIEHEGTASRLRIGRPGEPSRSVRAWESAYVLLRKSPDGHRLHVRVGRRVAPGPPPTAQSAAQGPARLAIVEEWVYEVAEDRWIPLPIWDGGSVGAWFNDAWGSPEQVLEATGGRSWAGSRTFIRQEKGLLAFEDLDAPGKLRYVLGGPGS